MSRTFAKWNPRGSLWHRWDPHLHAPGTLLNDQFKGDWTTYIERVQKSVPKIRALGVTDYFCIEAYKAVRQRYERGEIPHVAFIFPNVEFRLDIKTHAYAPINLHLLFSPDDQNHVDQIDRILGSLQYEYKGRQYRCTVADLAQLGRAFNPAQQDGRGALVEGAKQFKVTLPDLRHLFRTESWLRENCLVAVSGRTSDGTSGLQKDDSFASTREEIERFADIIFVATPKDRNFWLGKKPGFDIRYIDTTYGGPKPCLHGSDAHRNDAVGKPDQDRYCWIKGDLAFESLRQATLEPGCRVWIGSHAPNHNTRPLSVADVSTVNAPWQRTHQIPLNDGLVTVIGPRGSGKTALVDMIAAAASAVRKPAESSFLLRASQPADLLGNGRVILTWSDGTKNDSSLRPTDWSHDRKPPPAVRYLSQHFVDRLCSSGGLGTELRREIERVVFDATDPTDRLEANSFQELADVHLGPVRLRREELKRVIASTSGKIIDAGRLHAKLPQLETEKIRMEEQVEREQKQQGSLIPKGHEERAKRLAQLERLYSDREAEIQHLRFRVRKLTDLLAEVRDIQGTTEPARLQDMVDRYRAAAFPSPRWQEFAMEFRGEVEDICKEAIRKTEAAIRLKREEDSNHTNSIAEIPETDWPLSVIGARRDALKKEVGIDVVKVKRYAQLAEAIRLNSVKLRRIREAIAHAKSSRTRRQKLIESRRQTYEAIFRTLVEEEDVLRKLYLPLSSRLSSGDGALSKLKFTVRRTVDLDSWDQRGEGLLDLRKSSALRGIGSLKAAAEELLLDVWQAGDATAVGQAMDDFRRKYRVALIQSAPAKAIGDERMKWEQYVADWLYDTAHIRIGYGITYGGVNVEHLSPGTRGTVLLLLYLVIDSQDRRPLIIDQPEENLDPRSVYRELVPQFREACERRQVIVVTHNANLVVNTDSDQVIVADSRQTARAGLPDISYAMGSLENPEIRAKVCETLEGGERAFLERERRYRLRWDVRSELEEEGE